jgi:hypothetical protein
MQLILLMKKYFFMYIAIPSMMFGIYFIVCLRAVLARLVPERDKGLIGEAFRFVALILVR